MLLAFDVGNTNIVLGVFKEGKMITNWRLETDNNKSADEYGMIVGQLFRYQGLDITEVRDVIISTVVPQTFHHHMLPSTLRLCMLHHYFLYL